MRFFLNKCVYTIYALVAAWISIISLSALKLTFFFGGYGCHRCLRPQNAALSSADGWRVLNSTTVWLFKLCRSEGETEVVDFRKAMTSDGAICAARSAETESPLAMKLQCHIR